MAVLLGVLVCSGPAGARPLVGETTTVGVGSPVVADPIPRRATQPGATPVAAPPHLPDAALGTHRWPVDGAVVATFQTSGNPYGPGHRGVDLAVAPGTRVRAMAGGTVGFAGVVAGRAWVSLDHPGGLRTTVGPLATVVVAARDRVAQSDVVGTAAGTAHADAVSPRTGRVHVSARVHGSYLDPTPLVGALVATLLPPAA